MKNNYNKCSKDLHLSIQDPKPIRFGMYHEIFQGVNKENKGIVQNNQLIRLRKIEASLIELINENQAKQLDSAPQEKLNIYYQMLYLTQGTITTMGGQNISHTKKLITTSSTNDERKKK